MHMGIHLYICLKAVLYCPGKYPEGRRGSWGDANKFSPSECFECNYQFHLRILSCMTVCCNITVDNTGEDGKTVSGWPSTSNPVPSTGQYFVSRATANSLAPTIWLLRASIRVFQLVVSPVVNHALSISRSWSSGVLNSVRMLFSFPVLTFSLSPRLYHRAATSRTPSSTQPRSSELSLFPEWSGMGLYDSILYKSSVGLTPRLLPLICNL